MALRSLGKFFGLAGLRLGFIVLTKPDIPAWRQLLGDWPVSGDGMLEAAGLRLLGCTDLFGLFEAPFGIDLLDHLRVPGS